MVYLPPQSEAPALRAAIAAYLTTQSGGMDWSYTSSEPTQIDDPKGLVWIPQSTIEPKGEDGQMTVSILIRVVLSGTNAIACGDRIHDWGRWLAQVMSDLHNSYTEAIYGGIKVKTEWVRNIRPYRPIEYDISREGLQRQDSSDRFAVASLKVEYETEIILMGVNFC